VAAGAVLVSAVTAANIGATFFIRTSQADEVISHPSNRIRAVTLVCLLSVAGGCATVVPPPAPAYWVFSWSGKQGNYRYVVVGEREKHSFLVSFKPSYPAMRTPEELEARLRELPKETLIGWGESDCIGLTFPPTDIMRSVRTFAASNKINLIIVPGTCE
jgi:hypothetical protein